MQPYSCTFCIWSVWIIISSQKEYFQDDIFPDTTVTWEPSVSAADWLNGGNTEQRKISLRPPGMKLRKYCSEKKTLKEALSSRVLPYNCLAPCFFARCWKGLLPYFAVSEAPKVEVVKKYHSHVELEEYKTDEQKKEEVCCFCVCDMRINIPHL